jgi:gamma-glutamyltranspeptidase/glutathione hydrolase
MVVSEEANATRVGVAVLAAGGNAVDAAVATALALAVTHPVAGNLGGGGFAVVRIAGGEPTALDFRETAPGAATRDMYLGADGKPSKDSLLGHRAAGVPGSVAGLWALHKRHGKKPWAELVAPAVALAQDGFVVEPPFAQATTRAKDDLARFPASAALFLPGGAPPAVGSIWKNPDLAGVLARLAARGPEDFYSGATAKLLTAEMKRGGGLVTAKDLRGYAVAWRTPVAASYRGHTLYSMPPPSSGGVVLALSAALLAGDDLAALGWHSPAHVHLVTEVWRRAYALRNELLGDPAFVKVPIAEILSPAHVAKLRATIDAARATPSRATPMLVDGRHTTHLGVVDAEGNAVALTTTVNTAFGAKVVVEGAGFLLNNEMDDFAAKPGTANTYGLVQGEANAIAPGKRMLSSMSPTLVVDASGRAKAVLGAQGGSRIITAVWQVLSNVIDFGMPVGAAVAAPRFHHQHLPDVVLVDEGTFASDAEAAALKRMGYDIAPRDWDLGNAPSIVFDGQRWTGAIDPRRSGLALGL